MLRGFSSRAIIIILPLLLVSFAFSQERVIDDQAEFLGIISGSDFVWDQNGDASSVDYTFNPGAGQTYTYTIPSGQQLTIEDGTVIHIAPNVTIRIEGELVVIDDQDNGSGFSQTKICGTDESNSGQLPWTALEVVGNSSWADADGKMTLTNCLISGGGAGSGWSSGSADWSGLIRLVAPPTGAGPFKPELNLTNCTLQRSQNNGIVVSSAGNISGACIRVNGLVMNRGVEDAIDYRIQGCGIKIGDINLSNAATDKLENEVDVVDAQIARCGLHGVYVWLSGGTSNFRRSSAHGTSYIRLNGWRSNSLRIAGATPIDYYPQKGCGIYFAAYGELGNANDLDDIETISNVEVDQNTWDGVRLENNWAKSTVELSNIHGNSETGLFASYGTTSRIISVLKNTIYSNGYDGVLASKGSGGYAAIELKGNTLYSNHQSGNAEAEVSEIRLKGHFGTHSISSGHNETTTDPQICNNNLHGGVHGIGILRDGKTPTWIYPTKVVVENNFIYGFSQNGLTMDYDPSQGQPILSPEVRNNTFYNITSSGIKVSGYTPTRTSGTWIQNNIFSTCGTGIKDDSPDNNSSSPSFTYNGFYSNTNNTSGCSYDGSTSQTGAPQFVSTTSGQEDFHLQWNSPLINRGDPSATYNDATIDYTLRYFPEGTGEPEDITIDGSRNDIGAYGGARAADYGFNPYNAITSAAYFLSGTLRGDYYRAFVNYEVTSAQALSIEERTFIGNETDVQFRVNGELDVAGSLDHPVFITGYNQARWVGIYFTNTSSAYSDLTWLDVSYCNSYGVCFSSVPDVSSQIITMNNCVITHCRDYGISVYNSRIELTGNSDAPDPSEVDIDTWVLPAGNVSRGNTIRNVRGSSTSSQGIKLQYCGLGDVTITGTKIYLCGNPNSSTDPLETGVYIFDSDPLFYNTSIFHNGNTGAMMMMSAPTFNDYDASGAHVNSITGNGFEIDSTNGDGAELSVWYNSAVFGDYNDMYGDDKKTEPEKKRKGYLIWCGNTGNIVYVANNYLGTNVVPITDPDNYFNSLSQTNWQNNVATMQNDNWIADVRPIKQAIALFNGEYYQEAAAQFQTIITDDPTDQDAAAAVRYYVESCSRLGGNLDGAREFLHNLAESYPDLPLGLHAELLVPKTLIEERRFEDALSDYEELAENGDNAAERGLGQVNALELERMIEGEQVQNANGSLDDRINKQVNDLLLSMIKTASAAEAPTPAEFMLVSAFPNPFNSTVTIKYSLPSGGSMRLAVYDLAGREVAMLQNGSLQQGNHSALWQADGVAAGLYICRLESNGKTQSTKMLLVK